MSMLLNAAKAWILFGFTALTMSPSTAVDDWARVAYEPVALGWSAAEVERATAGNLEVIIARAKREGEFGCLRTCDRVRQIFDRLVTRARVQTERSRQLHWSLTVVRTADVEAMTLPGGQVLISEAFVDSYHLNDEALAFVLAHEMAHSILEHERQTLHFARMLLPREVPRSVADMYVELDYNFALLKSIEPMLQKGEFEADELGLLLASVAGYAPQAQLGFVEQEAQRDHEPSSLVRTHPPARQRLEQLRLRLPLAERLYAAARAARE